ncbi:MAG: DMT family transporter [Clostridia bacterium]|nr:DMT family transporter [Clostridia bacterium]
MDKKQLKYGLLLVLTALIWGTAFVAQSQATDDVGPFTFNAARMLVGCAALLPCIRLLDGLKAKGGEAVAASGSKKTLLLGGACCGAVLFVASAFQQAGIGYTSVGKAGFITALYIVLVPLAGLLLGRKTGAALWAGVGLAVAGMYLLCMSGEAGVNRGDVLCFFCALFFTGHILVIDHFSPMVDGVRMSCLQFFVAGALSLVAMLIFEKPDWPRVLAAWFPILYAGVLSSAVGYTLQIVAQKNVNPTLASLIMSLESVFSALSGWLILGERLTGRELAGCALMFAAIVLAQLPGKTRDS